MSIQTGIRYLVLATIICILFRVSKVNAFNLTTQSANSNCKNIIYEVAVSPDGKYLAAISSYEELLLWNTETGEQLARFSEKPTSVAFSADSNMLLVGRENGNASLYEIKTKALIKTFSSQSPCHVIDVKFLPDGKNILTADCFGAHLWDIQTGKEILSFLTEGGEAIPVISPDGKYLLLNRIEPEDVLVLWNLQSGEELHVFNAHYGTFSPDGKYILTYITNNDDEGGENVIIWDSMHLKKVYALRGWGGSFSADNKYALTRSGQAAFIVWSMKTGQTVFRPSEYEQIDPVVKFASDSGFLLVYLRYNHIDDTSEYALQEIATGKEHFRSTVKSSILDFILFPNGDILGILSGDHYIHIQNLSTGKELFTLC
jgi:WD40 repeat protein